MFCGGEDLRCGMYAHPYAHHVCCLTSLFVAVTMPLIIDAMSAAMRAHRPNEQIRKFRAARSL